MIRNPAVADIHFRKDGQCDVNAQFQESLGEPLRKRPGEQCDGLKLFDTVKEVEGAVDKVATAKHVKFVGAANTDAGDRFKKVAELLGCWNAATSSTGSSSASRSTTTPSLRCV